MYRGSGDDVLIGGSGADQMWGETDADTVVRPLLRRID